MGPLTQKKVRKDALFKKESKKLPFVKSKCTKKQK